MGKPLISVSKNGSSSRNNPSRSMSNFIKGIMCCPITPNKYKRLDRLLERKIIEFRRNSSRKRNNFRSINSIIMKFPQFREGLKQIKSVFEQFDADSNGTVDYEELRKCLDKLDFEVLKEEIDDLFYSCDIDENEGIQFNEFIVLLCLIYLLMYSSTSPPDIVTKASSPQIVETFDTIIEVFLFLDKNGDGKLQKSEVVKALNDACPVEKTPPRLTGIRFKEMDWDRNGKVSFREFLFAFVNWVGIDSDDDTPKAKELDVTTKKGSKQR